jgi:hypothetical protein
VEFPKLTAFDFPVEFEAKSFTLIVDKAGDDPQHAYLVQGWQPLLEAIAQEVYKPEGVLNDLDGWLAGAVAEISTALSDVDAWDQATTSDLKPFRCVYQTGPGLTGNGTPLVKVTVVRLFENDLERVLSQHGFPGGRRPGEVDDEDSGDVPFYSGKAMLAAFEGRLYREPGSDPHDPLDVIVPAPRLKDEEPRH